MKKQVKKDFDNYVLRAQSKSKMVFNIDFKRIQKEVFWGEDLQNLSDKLFRA